MARIRTIKPEFWTDDLIGSIKRDHRLLFIASWNLADDEGLLRWSAPYLKGAVFPYDDDISIKDIQIGMNALVAARLVFHYIGGRSQQPLGCITNFHKHQRINRPSPSKIPPPQLDSLAVKEMYAARDGYLCHLCGGKIDDKWSPRCNGDFLCSPDHVIPSSRGGSSFPSNIKASHVTCNKGKGDRSIDEYRTILLSGRTAAQLRWPDRFTHIPTNGSVSDSHSHSLSGSWPASQPYSPLEGEGETDVEEEKGGGGDQDSSASRTPPAEQGGEIAKEPPKKARKTRKLGFYEGTWDFERFWLAYPRQTSKGDARKAMLAVERSGIVTFEAVLAGIVTIDASELQFVKHPGAWLRAEGWSNMRVPRAGPKPPPGGVVPFKARPAPRIALEIAPASDQEWSRRLNCWRQRRQWDREVWGPTPEQRACACPRHLFAAALVDLPQVMLNLGNGKAEPFDTTPAPKPPAGAPDLDLGVTP